MTPTSRPLSAFTGSRLYLDTMIFYVFLRDPKQAVQNLFTRIADGRLQACTSVLTFDELTYKMLSGEPRRRLRPGTGGAAVHAVDHTSRTVRRSWACSLSRMANTGSRESRTRTSATRSRIARTVSIPFGALASRCIHLLPWTIAPLASS